MSQTGEWPSQNPKFSKAKWYNHYFWVYSWVPFLAAIIAGIMSLVVQRVKRASNDDDVKSSIIQDVKDANESVSKELIKAGDD